MTGEVVIRRIEQGDLPALTEGSETYVLKAGDCLGFGPPSDVVFANEGTRPCAYMVARS